MIYIFTLSATWFFFFHWWVWMLTSFSFFPVIFIPDHPLGVLKAFLSPSNVQNSPFVPTFHQPSATGFWAAVRYFHHALQSKPGNIFLLVSDWSSIFGFRASCWLVVILTNQRFPRGLSVTTAHSYHVQLGTTILSRISNRATTYPRTNCLLILAYIN
jgi:hypothetical protein